MAQSTFLAGCAASLRSQAIKDGKHWVLNGTKAWATNAGTADLMMIMVRTDTRGQFQFSGLAPGEYRLLATFEYQSPSQAEFDGARAVSIKIEESRDLQQDLTLFVAR